MIFWTKHFLKMPWKEFRFDDKLRKIKSDKNVLSLKVNLIQSLYRIIIFTFVVLTIVSADIFLGFNSINNKTTSYENFAKQLEKQERSVEVIFFKNQRWHICWSKNLENLVSTLQFDVTTKRIIGLFILRMIYLFFILKVFREGKGQWLLADLKSAQTRKTILNLQIWVEHERLSFLLS